MAWFKRKKMAIEKRIHMYFWEITIYFPVHILMSILDYRTDYQQVQNQKNCGRPRMKPGWHLKSGQTNYKALCCSRINWYSCEQEPWQCQMVCFSTKKKKKKKSLDCAFALVKFCSLPNIYEHLQPGNANASQKNWTTVCLEARLSYVC